MEEVIRIIVLGLVLLVLYFVSHSAKLLHEMSKDLEELHRELLKIRPEAEDK